jgi:hypothetical protein
MADTNVWLPIVTLVLGYAGSLATEAVRDKRQESREERAHTRSRLEVQVDRRADFQRDTLLRLQDALARLARAGGAIHSHDVIASREAGRWKATLLPDDLSHDVFRATVDTNLMVVRVEDSVLRDLVLQTRNPATLISLATSEEESVARMDAMAAAFEKANERLGLLLRELY